jgi:hypothetical protein
MLWDYEIMKRAEYLRHNLKRLGNYAFQDLCSYKLFLLSIHEEFIPEVLPYNFETPCMYFCLITQRSCFGKRGAKLN